MAGQIQCYRAMEKSLGIFICLNSCTFRVEGPARTGKKSLANPLRCMEKGSILVVWTRFPPGVVY